MKGRTKKYVKKLRKLPKFKPLPAGLLSARKYFAGTKTYARFYGNFITPTGKIRRFSFQVILDSGLSGWEKYDVVRSVCGNLLQNEIPMHEPGQIFSFHELLHHTEWIRVRKVLQYKVGMTYA